MMISIAIGSIIFTSVALLGFHHARGMAALSNYVDLDQYSRQTLDRISRDIRQTEGLDSFTATELAFNYQGSTGNLRYIYSPDSREFARLLNGSRTVLLRECDALSFSVYGRNNVSNQFAQFSTTNAANAKLVKFNWTCSRSILGAKVNTESVQSAKIVIRKQN